MSRAVTTTLALCLLGLGRAADPIEQEGYILPPKELAEIALAPWHKNVSVSNLNPARTRFVVLESQGMPSIAQLGKPYLNLAGLQVDTQAHRARRFTTRSTTGLKIVDLEDGKELPVDVPPGVLVTDPKWSPDGSKLAFFVHGDRETNIHVADAATGRSRRLTRTPLLATHVESFFWVDGGSKIVTVLRPASARQPEVPAIAATPRVRVSDANTNRIRTYPSLLDTPSDEALLEYYSTGQLAVVDVRSGAVQNVGKPAMILSFEPAPDGRYFRVRLMEKPFSRLVPMDNFPQREAVWDIKGEEKAEISKRDLRTGAPNEDQPDKNERRALAWRSDGAGLSFLQQEPAKKEGDKSPRKDRLMLWAPPFGKEDVKVVYECDDKINSAVYAEGCKAAFISQTYGGKERLSFVRFDEKKPYAIKEAAGDAFYDNPGELVTVPGKNWGTVALMSSDGKSAYLQGTVYDKQPLINAPRPFIDRVEIETGRKTRVFESRPELFEQPTLLDDDGQSMLVNRQSRTVYPNAFLVRADKSERQVTRNQDYAPEIAQAQREIVQVTRPDGFKFQATVVVPRFFVPGRGLPSLFWFYPSNVADQAAYDKSKRAYNRNLYPRIGAASMEALLRLGYALVFPDCPIVGPKGRENDTYVSQLRNNLSATIDELAERGFIDRKRLAIGGHSYGAFSAVNAMVRTPFFKAGIAGDGNYNRTLTPFGFQSETRQLWESRELYLTMSPFLFAEQITGALLMYHGMDDQNVGTAPMNSERLFSALDALGKPVALYIYPYEDHGQIAKETRLDLWARMAAWLEKYVKNAK